MIARLIERAGRRAARRLLLATRGVALRAMHRNAQVHADTGEVREIVALRLDRLGDLVLTLPALDDLAAGYPGARLTVLVRPSFTALLEGRRSVQRVVAVPAEDDWRILASRIAGLEPQLGVDFSSADDLLAARALHQAAVPRRVGLAGGGREVYFTATADPAGDRSLSEMNGRLVEAAGAVCSGAPPAVALDADEIARAESSLVASGASSSAPRIALHPGGYYASQRWPLENFARTALALAASRSASVVLLGGPGDEARVEALRSRLGDVAVAVPCGGLRGLAAVMSRCRLLLANNSGPLHLAGAVGLPTVSTMGPSDPSRFWPQGEHQIVLRRDDLPCSPCKRGDCAPHDCLIGISAEQAVRAAEQLLDRTPATRDRPLCGAPA